MRNHSSDSPDVTTLFEGASRAVRKIENEKGRPFGTPRKVDGNAYAKFGENVLIDPSHGAVTVFLPIAAIGDLGKTIGVKNVTASENNLRIQCAGGDTLEGVGFDVVGISRFSRIIQVAAAGEWIYVGGVN